MGETNAGTGDRPLRVGVIGAGAAGIAAAHELERLGHDATVFEARNRVGGRVWSDPALAAHPIELGAEFIHGENVATWDWVRDTAAPTTGAAHSYEIRLHRGGALVDARDVARELGVSPFAALEQLTEAWLGSGRPDTSLDQVLDTWPRVFDRSLSDEDRALLANLIAQGTSCDLEELGAFREREATYAGDGQLQHFRLLDGYSGLISKVAAPLSIRLEDPVQRVRYDDAGAEVTARSGVHRFDRMVVTLPLGALKREVVEFQPALPSDKREAIDRLNAGHISKIVLKLDRVRWPPELTFLMTPLSTSLWWRPGQGQPNEEPMLTAFFGGRAAAALDSADERDAIAEGLRQLGDILGESLEGRLRAGRFVAWGREPHTWMGYSAVPPGGVGLRTQLAAPVGALLFAGEATNPIRPATVHGAIESGRRAARDAAHESRRATH